MKKNNNSMFIVISGIIISVSRMLLGKIEKSPIKDMSLLIIMAVINFIAFGFVILLLFNDLNLCVKDKLLNSGADTKKKKNCIILLHIISFILLFSYLLFGILYLLYFKSNDLNDAISILALAFSIASNGLIENLKLPYYNLIIKLASISFKNIIILFQKNTN